MATAFIVSKTALPPSTAICSITIGELRPAEIVLSMRHSMHQKSNLRKAGTIYVAMNKVGRFFTSSLGDCAEQKSSRQASHTRLIPVPNCLLSCCFTKYKNDFIPLGSTRKLTYESLRFRQLRTKRKEFMQKRAVAHTPNTTRRVRRESEFCPFCKFQISFLLFRKSIFELIFCLCRRPKSCIQ